MTLYYAFVYPLLLYCNIIWGNTSQTNLWCIFKLKKMAIRLITSSRRRDRTTPLFGKLNIIRLPDLFKYSVLIFMFQYKNKKLPSVFDNFFQTNADYHNRDTRSKDLLRIPKVACNTGERFVKKCGVKFWMELSGTMMVDTTLCVFKKGILKMFTTDYLSE